MTETTAVSSAAGSQGVSPRTTELRTLADHYMAELAQHPVLAAYWEQLALVLKGSVARGNADHLSDLDFVFFGEPAVVQAVIADYYRAGLTARQDGVFLPLGNWDGHYHFEPFDHLAAHFAARHFSHIWEYRGAIALHDPQGRFARIVYDGLAALFTDPVADARASYLDLQLTLDWLRHPLKRGDAVAVLLHCTRLIQGLCQASYLLDACPYPHDKWLFHYLPTTRFGQAHSTDILHYAGTVAAKSAGQLASQPGLQLDEYPQYREGASLIALVADAIRAWYGGQPWLGEWYLYV
jgi:hypothetical protein